MEEDDLTTSPIALRSSLGLRQQIDALKTAEKTGDVTKLEVIFEKINGLFSSNIPSESTMLSISIMNTIIRLAASDEADLMLAGPCFQLVYRNLDPFIRKKLAEKRNNSSARKLLNTVNSMLLNLAENEFIMTRVNRFPMENSV